MADFLKFFNTNAGIKISSVTSDMFRINSKTFKTESLIGASGLNSVYSGRFTKPSGCC